MPYLIQLRGLTDALGNERTVVDVLPSEDVLLGEQRFVPAGPLTFDVTLTNTGAGIVGAGSASARYTTECSRCLRPFELSVVGVVESFYVEPADKDVLPEEQECEPVEDDAVDLEPAVRQAIVVELPFAPLHAEDCAGICPTCGADRNDGDCDCGSDVEDSPFSKLKELLEDR